MKNKALVIALFIVLAIPIPISLMTIIGTIISIANIGMAENLSGAIIPIITMVLAGTYIIPYIISLLLTIIKKKIHVYSFLPIIHTALFAIFFLLW